MNKLLPWDLAICLNSLRCILDFKFWDAPSLTFPSHLGNTKRLVFIWAWSSIFISETVVTEISQLFMLTAPHTWFIVAQVMSFGKWLSIIARSELGSDLDCSVINARSELGSDLDCYELTCIISLFYLSNKNNSSSFNWTIRSRLIFRNMLLNTKSP